MKVLILLLFSFFTLGSIKAQVISRQVADSMLKTSSKESGSIAGASIALKLADFYINKGKRNDIDSAVFFLTKAETISYSLKSPWAIAQCMGMEVQLNYELGRKKASILLVKSSFIPQANKDSVAIGKAYYELSRTYTNLDNQKTLFMRVKLVENAIKLLKNYADREDYGADLQMLADLYNLQGRYAESLDILKLALKVLQSIHHKKLQGIYVLFVKNYDALADHSKSLYYGLLAIKCSQEAHENGSQLVEIENEVGTTYFYLDKPNEAIAHFLSGIKIAEKLKDTDAVYTILINCSATMLQCSKFQQALKLINQTVKIFDPKKDKDILTQLYQSYIFTYVALRDVKHSKYYYEKLTAALKEQKFNKWADFNLLAAQIKYLMLIKSKEALSKINDFLKMAEKINSVSHRRLGYQFRYKIDSLIGNYESAYYFLQRYKNISDSIFNEKKTKQIQELEVAHTTQEKDIAIALLNQKAKLQVEELNQSRRITNETFAGILVMLIGGGVFVRHYHIRQKASRIIGNQNDVIVAKSDEIIYKNKSLERLMQEKENLLMEVQHRVKNNLHTVLSFLSLQARYLKGDALDAIKISRQRIYAMSLIHQKLYLAEDVKTIEIKSYLNEFITYFKDCLGPDVAIEFKLEIEPIRLPVTKAISIGLIINEAITNSAKYAFIDNSCGLITISLKTENKLIELLITDDGIGMPKDLNLSEFDSLGIKLIKGLTNDLGGTIFFDSTAGIKIKILFSPEI